jgi:hypothetical protein
VATEDATQTAPMSIARISHAGDHSGLRGAAIVLVAALISVSLMLLLSLHRVNEVQPGLLPQAPAMPQIQIEAVTPQPAPAPRPIR